MSEFQFVPGEYKTRDGRRAIVRFRVQEPTESRYPLTGEMQLPSGNWITDQWTLDGKYTKDVAECSSDLMPPVRYCYKNCFERDTGGKYETDPCEYDAQHGAKRYGVLRFELDRQGRPEWSTVEFIPVENLEHA